MFFASRKPLLDEPPAPACACPSADTYVQHALRHAAFRAAEAQLRQPLVCDSAAKHVSTPSSRRLVDASRMEYVQSIIQTRYRLEFLNTQNAADERRMQLVLLGGAFDSGALRHDSLQHALVTFQVDFEPLVELRRDLLRKAGQQHTQQPAEVMLDTHRDDWAVKLLSNGFDTCVHTVWLVDYTSPIVSNIDFEVLLRDVVALSRPGSAFLLQLCRHHHPQLLANSRRMFRRAGFAVMGVDVVGDCNASFGRWSFDFPGSIVFITASKSGI